MAEQKKLKSPSYRTARLISLCLLAGALTYGAEVAWSDFTVGSYNGSVYGVGTYTVGFVPPPATPAPTTGGGGGLIVGSGPMAPGYVNTNPTNAPTTTVAITSPAPTSPSNNNATTPGTTPAAFTFTRDLQLGSKGADVTALQKYLNTQGFTLANRGPGSPGNETAYFGNATKYQLGLFQKAHGISPTAGYFGPKTRAFVEAQ